MASRIILSIVCIASFAHGVQQSEQPDDNTAHTPQPTKTNCRFGGKLDQTQKILRLHKAGFAILNTFANVWTDTQPYLAPDEDQRLTLEYMQLHIEALKIERDFKNCLVSNAFAAKESDLPRSCTSLAKSYLSIAGIEGMAQMKSEFRETMRLLQEQKKSPGYSAKTKVLIGLGVTTVVVGGTIVLVPIVFPGTFLALKITAGMAYLKTTALSILPSSVTSSTTLPTSAVGAAAACAGSSDQNNDTSPTPTPAPQLSFAQKLDTAVQIMEYGQIATAKTIKHGLPIAKQIRPFVYELPEEELSRLQASRESLSYMLCRAYGFNKNL